MKRYPLEWFDSLISVTLNSEGKEMADFTLEQINNIIEHIKDESFQVKIWLKRSIFFLNDKNKIKLKIKLFHSCLIVLLNQTAQLKNNFGIPNADFNRLLKVLAQSLEDIMSFTELRFSKFISLDELISYSYLAISKKELEKKVEKLKKKYYCCSSENKSLKLVLDMLHQFLSTNNYRYKITFRDVFYKKEIVRRLEDMDYKVSNDFFEPWDELLIYLNFNSKQYINNLTEKIANDTNAFQDPIERMDRLMQYYKVFNQLHHKPDIVFNPKYYNLTDVMNNWFIQEMFYLDNKLHTSVLPLKNLNRISSPKEKIIKNEQKILCILSSDQMALVLRSADELRILKAKSLNAVFKTIVPYLSTPYKENLSYDAMRSKSYIAEERDKQIAIEALEKIIKKIKEY